MWIFENESVGLVYSIIYCTLLIVDSAITELRVRIYSKNNFSSTEFYHIHVTVFCKLSQKNPESIRFHLKHVYIITCDCQAQFNQYCEQTASSGVCWDAATHWCDPVAGLYTGCVKWQQQTQLLLDLLKISDFKN